MALYVEVTEDLENNLYNESSIADLIDRLVHTTRMAEIHWAKDPQGNEWVADEERVGEIKEALVLKIKQLEIS